MKLFWILGLIFATGCFDEGDDTDGLAGGVITFTVDGQTFTEGTDVSAVARGDLLSIGWNATSGGDLGEDYYGSILLSAYTGAGTYAPVMAMSDVDMIVEIAADGGSITYYPLGESDGGDGSVEVTSASDAGATGTFSYTGQVYDDPTSFADISGTFDVIFTIED